MAAILGTIAALSVVENTALYSLQKAKKTPEKKTFYFILGALIYGLLVPIFLYRALAYEGVGLVNFFWNIVSTLSAFAIGYYFFGENISQVQKVGVGITIVGLGLVLLFALPKQETSQT